MFFEINKNLLNSLNNLANYKIIENLVFIFSDLPIFFIPLFLIFMWIRFSIKKEDENKNNLLYIFYSTVIAIIIAVIIQSIIKFDRPENYIKVTWKLILKHIPDASFPSDHATVSFAFLTSLFFSDYKKIWFIILPFFTIMVLSRIIAWIHWPFDVIVWIIIWILSSFLTFKFITKIKLVKKLNFFIIKYMKYIKL